MLHETRSINRILNMISCRLFIDSPIVALYFSFCFLVYHFNRAHFCDAIHIFVRYFAANSFRFVEKIYT